MKKKNEEKMKKKIKK